MKTEKISTTTIFQLLTSLAIVAVLAVTPAFAQTGYPDQAAEQQMQPQTQNFDESTLNNFATTVVELGEIQDRYSQRLQGAQDQEQAVEIQQKMNDEMIETVHDQGLDVETYNAIANQMSTNPDFQQRVEQMIEERIN